MKIGLFDSGVGGLAILKEVKKLMPQVDYYYVADQAHVPYANKSSSYIKKRSLAISNWLIKKGVDLIIVACNTATVSAISQLRSTYPIHFVGVEPAIKPAALETQSGTIIILATDQTLHSKRLKKLIKQFGHNKHIVLYSKPQWLQLAEKGKVKGKQIKRVIKQDLKKIKNPHSLVLACTHYLFFIPVIKSIFPKVKIYNPAPAIAKQTKRLIKLPDTKKKGVTHIFTTSINRLNKNVVKRLLGSQIPVKSIQI